MLTMDFIKDSFQIKSLSDMRTIVDNLGKYPIPKLNAEFISMMCGLINLFRQGNQEPRVVNGLELVISLIKRALDLHTYSSDDWDCLATHLSSLIHNIFELITYNPEFVRSVEGVQTIDMMTDIFLPLTNVSPNLKNLVIEMDGRHILRLICWDHLKFTARRNILSHFKKILSNCTHVQRKALAESNSKLMARLVEMLPSCGDMVFQEYLIETLIRFALSFRKWIHFLKSWFSKFPAAAEAVTLLDLKDFESSTRKFLNMVNESQPPTSRVFSLPSLQTVADGTELHKPNGYDELWIDLSPCTGDVDLLIDGGAGNWARVSLEFRFIRSIKSVNRIRQSMNVDEECCEIIFYVHPPLVLPLEPREHFSTLKVLFKKDNKFLEAENNFFKQLYAHAYEPGRPPAGHVSSKKSHVSSAVCSSFGCASSSSKKTSLRNATLSTIQKTSDFCRFSAASSLASSAADRKRTQIKCLTNSTPLKVGQAQTFVCNGKRQCVETKTAPTSSLLDQKMISDKMVASSGIRSSVTAQIERFSMKDKRECQVVRNEESSEKLSAQVSRSNNSNLDPKHSSSFSKLMGGAEIPKRNESFPDVLPCTSRVQNDDIASMTTNERITPDVSIYSPPKHSPVIRSPPQKDSTEQHICNVEKFDSSKGVQQENSVIVLNCESHEKHHKESSRSPSEEYNSEKHLKNVAKTDLVTGKAMIEPPPVFLGTTSVLDFKQVQPPEPNSQMPAPLFNSCTKKSFCGFRKSHYDPVQSEASVSSASTQFTKRNYGGTVQIREAQLNLNASLHNRVCEIDCSVPDENKNQSKAVEENSNPRDPFSFAEEDENIENYKSRFNNRSRSSERTSIRKLFNPGRGDMKTITPESDVTPLSSQRKFFTHFSEPQKKRSRHRVMSKDETEFEPNRKKYKKFKKQNLSNLENQKENCPIRRSSRSVKKVNYKEPSSFDSFSCTITSFTTEALIQPSARRRVDHLRSEAVTKSPPSPEARSPVTREVDVVNLLSPPRFPGSPTGNAGFNAMLSPPPPPVEAPLPPSESLFEPFEVAVTNAGVEPRRKKKGGHNTKKLKSLASRQSKSLPNNAVPTLTSPPNTFTQSVEGTGVRSRRRKNKATANPVRVSSTNSEPTTELSTMPPATSEISLGEGTPMEDQTQVRPQDKLEVQLSQQVSKRSARPDLKKKIDLACDKICDELKTYFGEQMKPDDTTMMESMRINLATSFETHKRVVDTVREESLNIARSAANIQSACEKELANFEVVLEMINAIEEVHRESTVVASVRNNDPRTFSRLRQKILSSLNDIIATETPNLSNIDS